MKKRRARQVSTCSAQGRESCSGRAAGDRRQAPLPIGGFRARLTQRIKIAKTAFVGLVALCGIHGCMVPTMSVGLPALSATPNPSTDGAYTVAWSAIGGASKYQLHENGKLSYQGTARSQAYAGKPAGAYAYSLTYCIVALGIEAYNIPPGLASVTVSVSTP